jgi:hypothetical protein
MKNPVGERLLGYLVYIFIFETSIWNLLLSHRLFVGNPIAVSPFASLSPATALLEAFDKAVFHHAS